MTPSFRLLEGAADDLAGAVRWYEGQRSGLGADLFHKFAQALARISQHPQLGEPVFVKGRDRLRRARIDRFPYRIVYEIRPDEIVIVAVGHTSRKPNFWKTRV